MFVSIIAQSFGPPNALSGGWVMDPDFVATSDIDNDGDLDIISTSHGNILWSENLGEMNFGIRKWVCKIGFLPSTGGEAAVGDIDNDGDNDIIAAGDGIKVCYNNGENSFETQHHFSVSEDYATINLHDVDGDSDLDILVTYDGYAYNIGVFENTGNGTFSEEYIELCDFEGTDISLISEVHFADMDNDGDLDLLSCTSDNNNDNKVFWIPKNSNNTFDKPIVIKAFADSRLLSVFPSDLDNDGLIDIIVANKNEKYVCWLKNMGDGAFSEKILVVANEHEPKQVFSVDITGNDLNDILVGTFDFYGVKLYYLENQGYGIFNDSLVLVESSENKSQLTSVCSSDLNNDGDFDIVAAYSNKDDKVSAYNNDGSGVFEQEITISSETPHIRDLASVDVNGDGLMDLISLDSDNGSILQWNENLGNNQFGPFTVLHKFQDEIFKFVMADLNNDGHIDIAGVTNGQTYYESLIYLQNKGDNNFEEKIHIASNLHDPSSIEAIDIDNDGDLDLLSSIVENHNIGWFKNDGDGNFEPIIIELVTNNLFSIGAVAIDLTGDNLLDILVVASDALFWYENKADEGFGPRIVMDNDIYYPLYYSAADVDSDGDMDFLANDYGGIASIFVYENEGQGQSFLKKTAIYHNLKPVTSISFDVDMDGKNELVWSSESETKVGMSEVFGDMEFELKDTINNNLLSWVMITSDLDNDGDLDLVTISEDCGLIWYENLSHLSIDEVEDEDCIIVFPNPSSGKFQIKTDLQNYSVTIHDLTGKVVYSSSVKTLHQLNVSPGIYILTITSGDNTRIERSKIIINLS